MKKFLIAFVIFLSGSDSFAQQADSLHRVAKQFMHNGDYANAVIVLNNALKKDPDNIELQKDLTFTYYLQRNYSSAVESGRLLIARPDADEQCYQILGMAYKAIDEKKEADKMYKQGIKKFPGSGELYNEYGEMLWVKQDAEAIRFWEKGIEVDPGFSSNYYNASKYYYFTYDKTWSLIYGEIFINLESYSKRTPEIKLLLTDGYKKLFTELKSPKNLTNKNPFTTAYLTVMNNQAASVSLGITPESLNVLRSKFVLEWFEKYGDKYPYRLFEYQRQLLKEGMFEAYNQWAFGTSMGLASFQNWTTQHAEEYNRFISFQKGRVFKLPAGQELSQSELQINTMIKPERLFDCIAYQLEKFPKPDMLAAKEKGEWRKYSTKEISETVDALASGLAALGVSGNDMSVEQQDKIAIISNNRPEWLITDMAVQKLGAVLVPVYPTTNNKEIEFIFHDASVKYVFVSGTDLFEKIKEVRPGVPSIQNVFSFDQVAGAEHWSSLLLPVSDNQKEELQARGKSIQADHIATIIYTSGTTGIPKGVMLTHRNILSNVMLSKESFPFEDRPDFRTLSFLPLNHIFEKMVSYIYMFSGNGIYYAESMDKIGANLLEVKPDLFCTVPRLLEKVYERIMDKGAAQKGIKKSLFFWAVGLGKKYDNNKKQGLWYSMQLALANKLIFNKWREALGNNIKYIITGGAACQERLIRIFTSAGLPVYEGYGPTENSPVISVNRRGPDGCRFGTVGPVLNGVELRLEEDGEISVKGPSVMKGYFKRPDLTAETIIDGWLHTGDIGILEDGKFLRITDRKKELFKTSGGKKYVAPSAIENKLIESRFIEQVIVVGAEKKFVGALIVPAFAQLREWCKQNGLDTISNESMIHNPAVIGFYKGLVNEYNLQFNHVEQIKKFELLPAEWSIEKGELTPKMNVKRKIIAEKYKSYIDRIYS